MAPKNDDRSGNGSVIRSPSASGGCKLRSPLGMPGEPYAIHRFERECVAALGPGHITGDGLLAELGSVLDAVCCAIEVQWALGGLPDRMRRIIPHL